MSARDPEITDDSRVRESSNDLTIDGISQDGALLDNIHLEKTSNINSSLESSHLLPMTASKTGPPSSWMKDIRKDTFSPVVISRPPVLNSAHNIAGNAPLFCRTENDESLKTFDVTVKYYGNRDFTTKSQNSSMQSLSDFQNSDGQSIDDSPEFEACWFPQYDSSNRESSEFEILEDIEEENDCNDMNSEQYSVHDSVSIEGNTLFPEQPLGVKYRQKVIFNFN